jgi:hypothetical protein
LLQNLGLNRNHSKKKKKKKEKKSGQKIQMSAHSENFKLVVISILSDFQPLWAKNKENLSRKPNKVFSKEK